MLSIYTPKIEDLWFKDKMLSSSKTMEYNHAYGGAIGFPKERWESWHSKWIGQNDPKYFYRYLKNNEEYIGEIAYHFDEEREIYILDILIHADYRERGFGKEGLKLLLCCAKENGLKEVYDDIAIDNNSIKLFLEMGFVEKYRTDEYIRLRKELI